MKHTLPHYPLDSPLWLFEENFRLLLELLSFDHEEGMVLHSAYGEEERLEISVVERSRYTLTIALRKSVNFGKAWVPDILMEARLYLDAHVAEVLAYQNCRRIPAPYAVHGSVPFHKDEKRQANRLLNELLEHCLRHGFRPVGAAA
jgi:uncharacterized protein YqiB (DUF1249 family)